MTVAFVSRASRFGDIRPKMLRGSGGFADVYEAIDSRNRRLALKVFRKDILDPEKSRNRLSREAEILRRVDTRGVARLVSADLDAEFPWIASEYIDGPNISEAFAQRGPFSIAEAVGIAQLLLQTLNDLHQQGISHRDLTPKNVIIGESGPVIVDFGSARAELGTSVSLGLLSVGTPNFLSPEAASGLPVGPPADVYATALVFLFMVSGTEDAQAEDLLGRLPPPLSTVLRSMLSLDPRDRPTASVAASLLESSTSATITSSDFTQPLLSPIPRRFSPLQFWALGAVSIAAGLTIGFLGFAGDGAPLTVDDILEKSQNNDRLPLSVRQDLGVYVSELALPDDWSIRRTKPNEIDPLSVLGTVEAFEAETPELGTRLEVSVEVLLGEEQADSLAALGEATPSLLQNSPVHSMVDQYFDSFEADSLPNGCQLARARDPKKVNLLTEPALVFVGASLECLANKNAITNAFALMIFVPEKSMMINVRSTSTEGPIGIEDFLDSIRLSPNDVVLTIPSQEPVGIRDLLDTSSWSTYSGNARFDSLVIGVNVLSDETLVVEANTEQNLQIRAFRLDGTRHQSPFDFLPVGRAWLSQPGESVQLPAISAGTIFLEFEQMDLGPLDIRFELVKGVGGEFLTAEAFRAGGDTVQEALGFRFSLPTAGASSSENMVEVLVDSVPVQVVGSWYGNYFGSSVDAAALFANPYSDYYNWIEADMAQLAVFRSDLGSLILKTDAYNWLYANQFDPCQDVAQYERQWSGNYLQWKIVLGCAIPDAWSAVNGSRAGAQYAPIITFALSRDEGYQEVLQGVFVPQSSADLKHWEDLVNSLLSISLTQ